MNTSLKILFLAAVLFLPGFVSAQEAPQMVTERIADAPETASEVSVAEQVGLLRQRKRLLEELLSKLSTGSDSHALATQWVRELSTNIDGLSREPLLAKSRSTVPKTNLACTSDAQTQIQPNFLLSRPVDGKTNEIVQLDLAWTEDQQINKNYALNKFIVEVAVGDKTLPNCRFARPVFTTEVSPSTGLGQKITVPKDILRTGQKYYWQVLAEFVPAGSGASILKAASNAPNSFKTAAQTFDFFERHGLTLQRAVSGDDATEGAQFGFLRTFNKNTVYTADFALIYNHRFDPTQRTAAAFQASVQGNLTSDETESEDALQFRAGLVLDRNLKRDTINHLYASFAAKYEADQKFKVGKFISENMVTPTFPTLGIGVPFGRSSDPVQFRWRPYFYFDIGRSFEKGDSRETEDTVFRLTPRVRTTLTLNFLRRAMNLNDTFIFVDDFFYFLPLEKTKSRHNMFTSGFVLQMTKDFGFGLTYKSGEAAPKFKHVHTFGGVLTIRFGKEE